MLTALGLVQKFMYALLSVLRLGDFLEPETASFASPDYCRAVLIRELLPVVKFADLEKDLDEPERCAVCLCKFGGEDEIR
ncbi:hypothetical protein SASPL_141060 [Salvia splendens]|uniref:Secreted protein n=1 Tax=Salvia splendens TaxID=180675 RepID=A0A8X8WSZ3_SALSN|nr:hypothetical protein SASPL_141060 [Salvia splendens]